MALIKCHECGNAVSTEAAACPHCGARPRGNAEPVMAPPAEWKPKGTSRLTWLVLILVGLLGITFFFGHHEADGSLSGSAPQAAAESYEAWKPIAAQQLAYEYETNTLAADSRYKGHHLAVSGTVTAISTDIGGSAYLTLVGLNEFQTVHAELRSDSVDTAATLRPGMPVKVQCTGNGDVLKSPLLKSCAIVR